MIEPLHYQLRVYLDDDRAARARVDSRSPLLAPLTAILDRHDARLVCQLDAFEDYVAQAERSGTLDDPLYRWTKATIRDPAMRAKHGRSFAIRARGQEVYAKPLADALEDDLTPIVGGDIVRRMSRHDTDPATTIPIPEEHRAPAQARSAAPAEGADVSAQFVRSLAEASPPKSVGTILAATAARDSAEAMEREQRDARIRDRAYYLWVESGRPEGRHDEFWLAAQAELYPDRS